MQGLRGSSFDISTVVMTTLISTFAMSAQGLVTRAVQTLWVAASTAVMSVLRVVFMDVDVTLTPKLTQSLETVISSVHRRKYMCRLKGYSGHISSHGWFLVVYNQDVATGTMQAQAKGMWDTLVTILGIMQGCMAPALGKDGTPAPSRSFWAIMYISPMSFQFIHECTLVASQSSHQQAQKSARTDTFGSGWNVHANSNQLRMGYPLQVFVPRMCADALQAFVTQLTSFVVEIPDTTPPFQPLMAYVKKEVQRDRTQLMGHVVTTRDAMGLEDRLLGEREYFVRAMDGTELVVTLGTAGMNDSYTGVDSLFVCLKHANLFPEPARTAMECVLAIERAALKTPMIDILNYRPKGRFTRELDGSIGAWHAHSVASQRPMDTITMQPERLQALLDDIAAFRAGEDMYKAVGTPWKRSYLLFGPPGTGKTTFLRAVATHFNLHICNVSVTASLTDTDVMNMFNCVPRNAMVVWEDVDRIPFEGVKRPARKVAKAAGVGAGAGAEAGEGGDAAAATEEKAEKVAPTHARYNLTLQGLLNAVDGTACVPGRLSFFTANDVGALDAAFTRPGRVDKHVKMDVLVTTADIAQMVRRFFKAAPEEQVQAFAVAMLDIGLKSDNAGVTPCALENLCLRYAVKGIEAAIENVGLIEDFFM